MRPIGSRSRKQPREVIGYLIKGSAKQNTQKLARTSQRPGITQLRPRSAESTTTAQMLSLSHPVDSPHTRGKSGNAEPTRMLKALVGCENFQRHNPKADNFSVHKFHYIEFWCPDAMSAHKRFQFGLGMPLVARSDQSTGNTLFTSYVLQSHELVFVFTSPQPKFIADKHRKGDFGFDADACREFCAEQGLGVRAIEIIVSDAQEAYTLAVAKGAVSAAGPRSRRDPVTGVRQTVAEVVLYGRAVLRFVSGDVSDSEEDGALEDIFERVNADLQLSFGLRRLDHAVGNVSDLLETVNYVMSFTGFHEFAEFTAEDVGTVDSGLNSIVLANNNEKVLLPFNEPTTGTKRRSQIQTFLDHNGGPGVQHLALKTDDILFTMSELRRVGGIGGFEMMERPSKEYYKALPGRIGSVLSPHQYAEIERLGLLADKDDQGVLLQIFTKPISERPTIFLEIIQRVGCEEIVLTEEGVETIEQRGGCGGFGKGNFSELFKSIEEYEKNLQV